MKIKIALLSLLLLGGAALWIPKGPALSPGLTHAQITQPAASGSSAPIFSTAVTGTSLTTSLNQVLIGPVTMVTPAADGSYSFKVNFIETAAGSGGTCTTGAVTLTLGFRQADTGVTYAVGTVGELSYYNQAGSTAAQPPIVAVVPGRTTDWYSIPRTFRAKAGTAITYQVTEQAVTNCTTPPVFTVRPELFYLGN